jgi:hypothetical protein
LVLVVLPWSVFWDRNLLLEWSPLVYDFTRSAYLRGAISGLGIINFGVGCAEVFDVCVGRPATANPDEEAPVLSTLDEVHRGGA